MSNFRWLDRDTVRAPHLALCLGENEFQAALKHLHEPPGEGCPPGLCGCTHTFIRDGKISCVVVMADGYQDADGIQIASLLVHEAVHVFQRLCISIGETSPSSEFEAYSIERISERLMREYARRMAK